MTKFSNVNMLEFSRMEQAATGFGKAILRIIIFTRFDRKITTNSPNSTFMVSFKRRYSYLCCMDNFDQGDAKLQSE